MASESEVMEIIIGPLSALYRPNASPDAEPKRYAAMVAEYVRFLEPYRLETLAMAMTKLRETYRRTAWPTPAHLLALIQKAAKELPAKRLAIASASATPQDWGRKILGSDWGKRAAELNCAHDLKLWAEEHPGEFPTDALLKHLEAAARKHGRTISDLKAGKLVDKKPLRAGLLRIAEAMQDREREVATTAVEGP